MDPNSAYITRRESDSKLWGQFVPGKAKDFDPKTALPDDLSSFKGCSNFKVCPSRRPRSKCLSVDRSWLHRPTSQEKSWVNEKRKNTWPAPVIEGALSSLRSRCKSPSLMCEITLGVNAFVANFDFSSIEKVKETRQLQVSWDELVN
eukprot:scaffold48_cov311-Pinguiococcus_pyrenoidosus.AAC.146